MQADWVTTLSPSPPPLPRSSPSPMAVSTDTTSAPSGAPISEAVRLLGVEPRQCLGVGDSRYDIIASREAGLGAVCLVHDGSDRDENDIDLSFSDIPAFVRYLRVVLR